jgi:hypothetical protein
MYSSFVIELIFLFVRFLLTYYLIYERFGRYIGFFLVDTYYGCWCALWFLVRITVFWWVEDWFGGDWGDWGLLEMFGVGVWG